MSLPFRPVRCRTLLLFLALCSSGLARAQQSLDEFGLLVAAQSRPSFAILGAGARAAGMGGAFTALADDASAVSFNPAGLALLVTPEASLVVDSHSRHNDHLAFSILEGGELEAYSASKSNFDSFGVGFASATFPFTLADRNLSFQLSYHRLIDLDFESDRNFQEVDGDGRPLADLSQTVRQRGSVYTLNLAAAYQLTERLSLGLTMAHWQGGWSFSSETEEVELDDGSVSRLRFDQTHDWNGWNVSVGALLRYRYLNVGGTFRLPFDGSYRVDSRLDTNFQSPFAPASTLDGQLGWPGSWTLGLAAKPLETWIVTADYAVYDWDDMNIEGLGDEPVSFFDLKPASTSTTENGAQWRFGTEVTFFPWGGVLDLRGGYSFEPRPERLTASGPRSRSRTFSAGVGFSRGSIAVDLAWQQARTISLLPEFVDPDAVGGGQVLLPADARVKSRDERLLLSLLYRFESRAGLKRFFHFLFVSPLESGDEPKAAIDPQVGGGDDRAEAQN